MHNPQFYVTLSVPDDEDEENLCTLIVSLMQKGRRELKHEGVGLLSIGNISYWGRRQVEIRMGKAFI